MSAGAPCSICLASAELAAYETVARFPVRPNHCALISSRAVFKLAAANTTSLELSADPASRAVRAGKSNATIARRRQNLSRLTILLRKGCRARDRCACRVERIAAIQVRSKVKSNLPKHVPGWYQTTDNGRPSNFRARCGQSASKIGMSSRGSSGSAAMGRFAAKTEALAHHATGQAPRKGLRLRATAIDARAVSKACGLPGAAQIAYFFSFLSLLSG